MACAVSNLTPDHIARSDNLRVVSDDKREAARGALIFAAALDIGPREISPEFPTLMANCKQCGAPFFYRKTYVGNPRLRCDACVKT
jgi:formylmethanofuran dehydrogenase subunit E